MQGCTHERTHERSDAAREPGNQACSTAAQRGLQQRPSPAPTNIEFRGAAEGFAAAHAKSMMVMYTIVTMLSVITINSVPLLPRPVFPSVTGQHRDLALYWYP